MQVLIQLDVLLDGNVPIKLISAAVADFPPVFRTNELGGLLSPQSLVQGGSAVTIDFRIGSMWLESTEASALRLQKTGLSPILTARACNANRGNIGRQLFTVPALVNGAPVSLLLDSGAEKTLIQPSSSAMKALHIDASTNNHVVGTNGKTQSTQHANMTSVQFAGLTQQMDIVVGAAASACGPDGLAGMDLLRSCIVTLRQNDMSYACEKIPVNSR